MKKSIVIMLVLGLIAGAMAFAPAQAGKKKAVATTLYLHGRAPVGEADLPDTWTSSLWFAMDPTEPADPTPKSMFVTNYVGGPNTACSGNGLLPTWKGALAGAVKGDLTVTLHTVATPATALNVELFPDGSGGCDSDLGSTGYAPPAAAATVDVPPGPGVTEVKFENVNFKAAASLVMMLSIGNGPHPGQVRVLFDGADYGSKIEFKCVPSSGKKCA
jgi:hypothetical protein